jgi:hypothetical protein
MTYQTTCHTLKALQSIAIHLSSRWQSDRTFGNTRVEGL